MSLMASSRSTAKLQVVRVCRHLRQCSTQPSKRTPVYYTVGGEGQRRQSVANRLLQQPCKTFPFPGDIAIAASYQLAMQPPLGQSVVKKTDVSELLNTMQGGVEDEHLNAHMSEQALSSLCHAMDGVNKEIVQLTAVDCPKLLKKDAAELFPDRTVKDETKMTVLNLTQKAENDMGAWSQAMEEERGRLTGGFIDSAMSICAALKKEGYWADFIDPSSGRPYLGRFTNATLFDTNDHYNYLGFKIEDLGCCKVIKHLEWGSKVLVGTIFTNAPIETNVMQRLLIKVNTADE